MGAQATLVIFPIFKIEQWQQQLNLGVSPGRCFEAKRFAEKLSGCYIFLLKCKNNDCPALAWVVERVIT